MWLAVTRGVATYQPTDQIKVPQSGIEALRLEHAGGKRLRVYS
jgi:hypothetical protein